MEIRQRGWRVTTSRIAGALFTFWAGLVFVGSIVVVPKALLEEKLTLPVAVGVITADVAIAAFILLLGSYWLGKYPNITYVRDRLEVKTYHIRYEVPLEDIQGILQFKRPLQPVTRAILIRKSRRGMFLNRLYGSEAGKWDQPAIFVVGTADNLERLESDLAGQSAQSSGHGRNGA